MVNSIPGLCAAFLTSSTGEEKKNAPGLKLLIGAPHPQANYLITHASSLLGSRDACAELEQGGGGGASSDEEEDDSSADSSAS